MAIVSVIDELLGVIMDSNKSVEDIKCGYLEIHDEEILCINIGDTFSEIVNKFDNIKNRSYNGGYGSQELYGIIWFKDGSWLERGEYDGSEWWEYKTTPEIPDFLK